MRPRANRLHATALFRDLLRLAGAVGAPSGGLSSKFSRENQERGPSRREIRLVAKCREVAPITKKCRNPLILVRELCVVVRVSALA